MYPALGRNADIIVGIGEEIIVTRPSLFGPQPDSVYRIVHESLKYRKMAHSAEEVTTEVLHESFDIKEGEYFFSDVRNGFVIKFYKKPDIDLEKLELLIDEKLASNLPISYYDEDHIMLGDRIVACSGSRFHVKNTSEIENFALVKRFIYDSATNTHCLVGVVDNYTEDLENRNTRYFLTRKSLR
ncbi:MAG: hypothetical protein ACOX09_03270 [Candidatus Kapaibacterium sp.]